MHSTSRPAPTTDEIETDSRRSRNAECAWGPRLSWSESFSVGHPALDLEHRALIAIINGVASGFANRDQKLEVLNSLVAASYRHTEHENALLQEIADSLDDRLVVIRSMSRAVLKEHVDEHNRSLEELNAMAAGMLSERFGNAAEFHGRLVHWFVEHAVKYDAQLKAVFQALDRYFPELFQRLV